LEEEGLLIRPELLDAYVTVTERIAHGKETVAGARFYLGPPDASRDQADGGLSVELVPLVMPITFFFLAISDRR